MGEGRRLGKEGSGGAGGQGGGCRKQDSRGGRKRERKGEIMQQFAIFYNEKSATGYGKWEVNPHYPPPPYNVEQSFVS